MKRQPMMGYAKTPKAQSNPDTINKLIGVKTPSFSSAVAKPINANTTKVDNARKMDIHVNDEPYEDGTDAKKDLRIEDAYNFLSMEIEDTYAEEGEEEVTNEEGSESDNSGHSSEEGDVSTKSDEDEFAAGDGVVKAISKARYAHSNITGALGGKRKYANRVDKNKSQTQTVRSVAGLAADHVGIDRATAQDTAEQGMEVAKHLGKGLSSRGKKAANWVRSKTKK